MTQKSCEDTKIWYSQAKKTDYYKEIQDKYISFNKTN